MSLQDTWVQNDDTQQSDEELKTQMLYVRFVVVRSVLADLWRQIVRRPNAGSGELHGAARHKQPDEHHIRRKITQTIKEINTIRLTCSTFLRCQNLPVWLSVLLEWERCSGAQNQTHEARDTGFTDNIRWSRVSNGTWDLMSLCRTFLSWMCFSPRQIWTNQSTIWNTHQNTNAQMKDT